MEYGEVVQNLVLELRRGTLILLVLAQLKKPLYGYELVKKLQENGVPVEAGTLYPLMRRLEGQGLLKSEWETSGAKPRKYYLTTQDGARVLAETKQHWAELAAQMKKLLEEPL